MVIVFDESEADRNAGGAEARAADVTLESIYERFRESARQFCSTPVRSFQTRDRVLYVCQREEAHVLTSVNDDNNSSTGEVGGHQSKTIPTWIGSQDATTCHILILRQRLFDGTDANRTFTLLAHLDDCRQEIVDEILKIIIPQQMMVGDSASPPPPMIFDTYLFGGFRDEQGHSVKLATELLRRFHSDVPSFVQFRLRQCVIVDLNTEWRKRNVDGEAERAENSSNAEGMGTGTGMIESGTGEDKEKLGDPWPIVYGVAINVFTGEIVRASFFTSEEKYSDACPEAPARGIRIMAAPSVPQQRLLSVYDPINLQLRIGPFEYENREREAQYLCDPRLDGWIRKNLSTSPLVEPPDFAANMRLAWSHLLTHPVWAEYFNGNQPKCYSMNSDTGEWIPVAAAVPKPLGN